MILRTGALLAAALTIMMPVAEAAGIIDTVNGITTDAQGRVIRFNALLIDREGRVEQRLSSRDKRPKTLDFRLDGKGRTLIPGFVDAHVPLMRLAMAQLSLDLTGAQSPDDIVARTAAYAIRNPGRRWLIGSGWDDGAWPDGTAPPRASALDAAAAGSLVWLVDATGTRGLASGAALAAAGINKAGGSLVTGDDFARMEAALPTPAPKDLDAAFLAAQRLLLERGITAAGDIDTDIAGWQTYRRAGDRGALRLRITGYAGSIADLSLVAGPAPTPRLYDDRLRLAGLHLALDGRIAAGAAWLQQPSGTGAPAPLLSDTALRNRMSRAAMNGFAVVLSAHGNAAVAEADSAITELATSYAGRATWRIDGVELGQPQGSLAAVVIAPGAIGDGGRGAGARLGTAANNSYGWADLARKGTVIAFMGNGPFDPLSPFEALRIAITRESGAGEPFGGWRPDQRLSFGAALRAATAGGAAALGNQDRYGALEPGQQADFLLLDRDIELARPSELGQVRILETWIGGRRVQLDEAAQISR